MLAIAMWAALSANVMGVIANTFTYLTMRDMRRRLEARAEALKLLEARHDT